MSNHSSSASFVAASPYLHPAFVDLVDATRARIEAWDGRDAAALGDAVTAKLAQTMAFVPSTTDPSFRAYVEHWREVLHPLFLQAPLIARAFRKPLGYAGDYEMMNMAYRNVPEGDAMVGRALHQWLLGLRPSRAVRNRRGWLIERLLEHAAEQQGGPYRVTSVACGPAKEVQDLAASRALDGVLEVTCLDQDREALAYAEAAISRAREASGSTLRASFEAESVKKILSSRTRRPTTAPLQNFIYSMGLYDYLPQRVGVALTRALYERLAPGGRLIVGNFVPCEATRFVMEVVMDWALIHRSASEMRALGDGVPSDAQVSFATEPTGLNGFLIVDRPRAC